MKCSREENGAKQGRDSVSHGILNRKLVINLISCMKVTLCIMGVSFFLLQSEGFKVHWKWQSVVIEMWKRWCFTCFLPDETIVNVKILSSNFVYEFGQAWSRRRKMPFRGGVGMCACMHLSGFYYYGAATAEANDRVKSF